MLALARARKIGGGTYNNREAVPIPVPILQRLAGSLRVTYTATSAREATPSLSKIAAT